jgi:hypothetical protein
MPVISFGMCLQSWVAGYIRFVILAHYMNELRLHDVIQCSFEWNYVPWICHLPVINEVVNSYVTVKMVMAMFSMMKYINGRQPFKIWFVLRKYSIKHIWHVFMISSI